MINHHPRSHRGAGATHGAVIAAAAAITIALGVTPGAAQTPPPAQKQPRAQTPPGPAPKAPPTATAPATPAPPSSVAAPQPAPTGPAGQPPPSPDSPDAPTPAPAPDGPTPAPAPAPSAATPPPGGPPPQPYPPPPYGYPYPITQGDPSEKPSKNTPTYRYENGTLIVTGPKTMNYTEGKPIPPGYHVEEKMRRGLAIAGIATLGGAYLISLASVAVVEDDGTAVLLIPVGGPFLALETTDTRNDEVAKAILLVDGVAQVLGTIMMIAGFSTSSTQLVRNDQLSLTVFPAVGVGWTGLGLTGSM